MMNHPGYFKIPLPARTAAIIALLIAPYLNAQNSPAEKSFPQSKSAVERTLKSLQSSLSGHLPTLDGFAQPGEHSLDRYQRAFCPSVFFQANVCLPSRVQRQHLDVDDIAGAENL